MWFPHDRLYVDLGRKLPELGVLDLSHWPLNDGDLSHLGSANKGCLGVRLAHCVHVTDLGISYFKGFKKAHTLDVSHTGVGVRTCRAVRKRS